MPFRDGPARVEVRIEFDGDFFRREFALAFFHRRWPGKDGYVIVAVDFEAAPCRMHGQAARVVGRRNREFDVVFEPHNRIPSAVPHAGAMSLPLRETKLNAFAGRSLTRLAVE